MKTGRCSVIMGKFIYCTNEDLCNKLKETEHKFMFTKKNNGTTVWVFNFNPKSKFTFSDSDKNKYLLSNRLDFLR